MPLPATSRRPTALQWLFWLTAAASLTGCGGAQVKVDAARQHLVMAHIYAQPCAVLWPRVRRVFTLQDYRVIDPGKPGERPMLSYWTRKRSAGGGYETRQLSADFEVRALERCRVRFSVAVKAEAGAQPVTRASAEEAWILLRDVDPETATAYERLARRAGE